MKIIQIMPFRTDSDEPMRLHPTDLRNRHKQYVGEHIGGMALVENEVGERSIEWVVWDQDRSIRVTSEFYTE